MIVNEKYIKEYEEMSKRIKIHNHIMETKETDIKKIVDWLKQPHTEKE